MPRQQRQRRLERTRECQQDVSTDKAGTWGIGLGGRAPLCVLGRGEGQCWSYGTWVTAILGLWHLEHVDLGAHPGHHHLQLFQSGLAGALIMNL